jgi:DNA primase
MSAPKHRNDRFGQLRQLPLRDVARRLGIKVNTRAIRCPLPGHEDKNPSFAFFFSSNTWKCFGCGRGGTTIDLVIEMLQCSLADAANWLEGGAASISAGPLQSAGGDAKRSATVDVFAPDHEVYSALLSMSPLSAEARRYLHSRAFSDGTIDHFQLAFLENGAAALSQLLKAFSRERLHRAGILASPQSSRLALPSNGIIFPFLSGGRIEYLQSRVMPGAKGPRWMGLTGVKKPIFNLDVLGSASTIYVCEGATDVLSAHELSLSAIGLLGASTRMPRDMLRSLVRKTVYVVPDNDPAGENMLKLFTDDLRAAGGTALGKRVPEGGDLNDYLVSVRGKVRGSNKRADHKS